MVFNARGGRGRWRRWLFSPEVEMAAGAHGDKISGNVDGADFMHEDEAKEQFEIGRHAVGEVEGTMLLITFAAAVERGVGGHEAEAHHHGRKGREL